MNREIIQQSFHRELPDQSGDRKSIAELETKLELNQQLLAKAISEGNTELSEIIEKDNLELIDAMKALKMAHLSSSESLIEDDAKNSNKKQYLN